MAETIEKIYVSSENLGHYDEKIKKVIADADAATLQAAKKYADDLESNYDAAGTAATKVQELANGAVKDNTDAIAKLNGADTVEGSVAKAVKDAKTELEGKITESQYDDTALSGRVSTVEGVINTLNGTGAGSVKKQIDDAFNEFATNVTDDDVVNTYKELIDYCATHSAEAAEMAGEISKNAEAIKTLETYVGKLPDGTDAKTVIDYINAKVGAVDFSDAIATAKQEAIDAAAGDATTKANQALSDAKDYADGLSGNYATSAQGVKADSAVQKADIISGATNGTISVQGDEVAIKGLGTAAFEPRTSFETAGAAQALADGQVATNTAAISALETKVGTLESVSYKPMTNEEIDALFANKAE